ncbi:hypothetical protein Tco_0158756 [Tanacetum coccineum]
MKSIWVKKESTVGSQAVLPQNVSVKRSAMINLTQTWRPKGAYLDYVNRDNGSYTLKQFEYNPEEDLKEYSIMTENPVLHSKTKHIRFDITLSEIVMRQRLIKLVRKNSPKFSGRITPLTSPMLEVITELAAEEAHSESTHSRAESSTRDAQGTPTQSAFAHARLFLQVTADFQDKSQTSGGDEGLLDIYALDREVRRLKKQNISQAKQIHKLTAKLKKLSKGVKPLVKHHILWVKSQKLRKRGKKQKKKVSSVKLGRNKDEELIGEGYSKYCLDKVLFTPRTLNLIDEAGPSNSNTVQLKKKRPEEQSLKRRNYSQQIRSFKTAHYEEVTERFQANGMQRERIRLADLKKPKPKTILKKPTSLTQERNQMMSFLKGQGYKNLQKLRYPQMKELYDKVQESIKDSLKDFIPIGSEKEKQMLQERDAKRLLRKRKATVTEEQPSKKLKLRTEKIDELRNYLRIVDLEEDGTKEKSQWKQSL